MDRRRGRPASSEEIDCWTHAAASLSTLSDFYSTPVCTDTVGRVNRLISAWPTDEVLPAEGIESVKSTFKKLTSGFEEITRISDKEIKAIDAALEQLGVLIALRKAPEVLQTEKRPKRPRGQSPTGTPVPVVPATGNATRVSITVPPRNSVGPGPGPQVPFSREPKARREALAAQLPLLEGRKVAFHPHVNKAGGDVESDTWILAIITKCINADKNRYEVRDPEPQENGANSLYNTTLRSIIPLPDPNAPRDSPSSLSAYHEFTKGSTVMALYPDTSTFYRAQVIASPRDLPGRTVSSYKLKFEDDDNQEHLVAAETFSTEFVMNDLGRVLSSIFESAAKFLITMSIARQLLHEFRPLFRMLDQPLSRGPALFNPRSFSETDPFFHFDVPAIRPAVDVTEEANRYILQADLPGVKKENIEVRVGGGGRSITIESKIRQQQQQEEQQQSNEQRSVDTAVTKTEGYNQLSAERPFVSNSTFTRTVYLPRPVDSVGVSAKLNDGVLTISVPKAEDKENVVVNIE